MHFIPLVAMETTAPRHPLQHPVAGGQGSLDDIDPEPMPLLLQERGAGPEGKGPAIDEEEVESERTSRRKKHGGGAHSLPPLLLQLKGLRENLPPGQVQVGGGGARALWRAVFSGNKKRSRTSAAETESANQKRATGEDRHTASVGG